jgi:hypothetical protein
MMAASFIPQHLSVSSVALYVRCPAQWKRRYVDRIVPPSSAAQATGTAFHKALEAEHRGQDAELAWIAASSAAEDALVLTGQSLTLSKADGLKLIREYRARGLGGVKGEPERKFVLPFPSEKIPVPLLGFMDLPVPTERHFRDFKTTGGDYWNALKVSLEPQVQAYGWAYQRLYRHRPEVALWVIFHTQKLTVDVYEAVPSADGFRLFEQSAEGVWQGIVNGRFDGCGECEELCKPPVARAAKPAPTIAWED